MQVARCQAMMIFREIAAEDLLNQIADIKSGAMSIGIDISISTGISTGIGNAANISMKE